MTGRSPFRSQPKRPWRKLRWAALATAIPALWACNSRRLEAPTVAPTRTFNNVFQETVNRDIDIVFMVDNSLSMMPLQTKLANNFPVFIQVLEALPGGIPNVHLAVVSSDMGAGRFDSADVPQCAHGGDQGIFQAVPRGQCTGTGLQANQNFISDVNNVTNFDPTKKIEDVFSCIAQLGQDGCGFEHQLASVQRALGADGAAAPAQNANFLRPNAFLSIILITNEDDCSAPPDSDLFNPASRFVSDQYGPLASFRCNEYGHLCNGMKPSRTMSAMYPPGACVSAEDGVLLKVSDILTNIKSLKPDPSKILVAAIAGPADPYNIELVAPALKDDPAMWPQIDHSCVQNNGEYADPAIRIKQFVEGFGGNGVFLPICAPTFAPALQRIAEEIGKVLGPKCVSGTLVQKNGQPDCSVVDHAFNDQGVQIDSVVPSCASNGNAAPCWALNDDAMNCPNAKVLAVNRSGQTLPSDLNSSVSCSLCIDKVNTAGCVCTNPDQAQPANGCTCGALKPSGCVP
jgi:hypothetical protein